MPNVRMVLEGGALRGLFTAGVLDVLMENNVNVDEIVGTSAGALFGVNYFSNQKGRAIRYNKKYCGDKRYMSLRSLILTGNYINEKFAFHKVTKELDPFDNETFKKINKKFYAVVTNVETGKPEYLKIESPIDDLEIIRATSAIPLASKIIKIGDKKYLDGGISDSIPVCFNKEKYDKTIIVLTQPLKYRKKPLSKIKEILIKIKYEKYPNLLITMMNRHISYNKTLDEIINMEKKGEVFVIRPSKKLNIKINENNSEKLDEIYNIGVNDAKKSIIALKKYLNNK